VKLVTMVEVGQRAPDARFVDPTGGIVRLSDFWRVRPTVFVFLRHFG
jgi:peroxiredoxin